jgi:uncharacterized surface protein with fasciclin (FAS1) repeats
MKKIIMNTKRLNSPLALVLAVFLIFILSQCEIQKDYEYEHFNPGGKLNKTAWAYIQEKDSMSLMEEAINAAGLQNNYSGSTIYTFIVPENVAWRAYLKTNKYANIAAIPVATLQDVLKYHIVNAKILTRDDAFKLANIKTSYPTLLAGQVMFFSRNTFYQGIINQDTKKAFTIWTSNLEPTNGVIHVTYDVVYLLQ